MPFSSPLFDKTVENMIRQIAPQTCLDIGAGAGKYGVMVKTICPTAHIIAVEIESTYLEAYKLADIYDEIRCMNAMNLIEQSIDESYDLVIMGDIIEHLRKSDGLDLLNFLVYRTRYLAIIYPERYLQNSILGKKHEAHISMWCEHDFTGFHHVIRQCENIYFVLIEGYLNPYTPNVNQFKRLLGNPIPAYIKFFNMLRQFGRPKAR